MKLPKQILVTTLGLTMMSGISSHAGNGNGNPNPGIVPPHAVYKGKTAGESDRRLVAMGARHRRIGRRCWMRRVSMLT